LSETDRTPSARPDYNDRARVPDTDMFRGFSRARGSALV
jgi:hypothetical protein